MVSIKEGSIRFIHCFDISEEIRMEKLATLLGSKVKSFAIHTRRLKPEYMQFKTPPILASVGKISKTFHKWKFTANVFAKIYQFGVVSIIFEIPFAGDFKELQQLGAAAEKENIFKNEATVLLESIRKDLEPFLIEPEKKVDYAESFTIFGVRKLSKKLNAQQLMKQHWKEIAGVVRQEDKELSLQELEGAVKRNFSYYPTDLVVIDWNGAFVFDEEECFEVYDIVEFSVVQLLELRAYDTFLDEVLDEAYDDLETIKGRLPVSPFSKTLNTLLYVRLEVTEIMEKVENSLKLIGDPYLAKLYTIAAQSFYLEQWQNSVRKKLHVLESTYTSIFEKVQETRMLILEALIVLLFVLDIITYFTLF